MPPAEAAKPSVAPPPEEVKNAAAAHQPAVAPPAPPAKPYTAGQLIDPSFYDAFRGPQGDKCEDEVSK